MDTCVCLGGYGGDGWQKCGDSLSVVRARFSIFLLLLPLLPEDEEDADEDDVDEDDDDDDDACSYSGRIQFCSTQENGDGWRAGRRKKHTFASLRHTGTHESRYTTEEEDSSPPSRDQWSHKSSRRMLMTGFICSPHEA